MRPCMQPRSESDGELGQNPAPAGGRAFATASMQRFLPPDRSRPAMSAPACAELLARHAAPKRPQGLTRKRASSRSVVPCLCALQLPRPLA
eukprot:CAMPEP_0168432640 /NCGR_PEP_ID=MMETSP0228-20121227/38990_1 /TAXON_ID=133427 /ORGANISM="Protoceratium reticulatum, Strain CCCM 535 (=CCMP 1889)" /LENGTH=90 /DNA_ID=CAMNT_0008446763 /DNA_START=354 /DNA_END=627 /DNA_ORIENTATION=+